jgi:hypothetical protein
MKSFKIDPKLKKIIKLKNPKKKLRKMIYSKKILSKRIK